MEASPLTLQTRPETFQPKIVQLYGELLHRDPATEEHETPSEGFWQEFFLLKPDPSQFRDLLESMTAASLIENQINTQALFTRMVLEIKLGKPPRNRNALETLTAFLGGVLTKKFTNPSSDVIEVLAGLDEVDGVISNLVDGLDNLIRNGDSLDLRKSAIRTALAMTAGAYQTGLVSYFNHRDLFPSLMKSAHEIDDPEGCFEPLLLLGLLANYNKFEIQNPYQLRIEDFVNEATIQQLVRSVGSICSRARDSYVAVADDLPEGWNLNSTLVFLGLRVLAPEAKARKAPPTEEETQALFSALPPAHASIALPAYSFATSNKIFATNLVSMPPAQRSAESPFSAFLSFTSYITQHSHRSQRCLHYATFTMLTIRVLVEDSILSKQMCVGDHKVAVRLCRQRAPFLPVVSSLRPPASVILDVCTETLSHNLRRRLDVDLYNLALGIMLRVVTALGRSKIRLQHHWAYIWGALLSLIRFLTQYASDLSLLPQIKELICTPLTNLIALCLSTGDVFLPDASTYDDLLYKLIETSALTRFRDAFHLTTPPAEHAIHTLIAVSSHYHALIEERHGKRTHQSPTAVQAIIKQGYETLNIEARDEFGRWEPWRESAAKAELKKMIRTVVEDARLIVD